MRQVVKCPKCLKQADVIREVRTLKEKVLYQFKCGHWASEKLVETVFDRDEVFEKAFKYQKEGVEFIEKANFNCLVADEMGLGKTIQALLALRYHYEELTPALIICKASLIPNWIKEYFTWVNKDLPIAHTDGQVPVLPGYRVYITSMDILSKPQVFQSIQTIPFKLLIIDECHNFKNLNAKRTSALMKFAAGIPHKIALSGTPILNKPTEYFPTLNLIKPLHFPSWNSFCYKWLEYDPNLKKYLTIRPDRRDSWFNFTSSFIIRREKSQVLKDLPPIRRNYIFCNAVNKDFKKAYAKVLDELEMVLARLADKTSKNAKFMDVLALLARLRHLTALAKIPAGIEHILEFLESVQDGKITVGIHHKDVSYWLEQGLREKGYNVITISGEDNAEQKMIKENEFRKPENRVLIANIIAAGEGRNLQFCQNVLILERQWNLAKESQFEGRFQRPLKCTSCETLLERNGHTWKCPTCGKEQEISHIQVDYLMLANSIDEFFHELVNLKGSIVQDMMDVNFEADIDFIYELADRVLAVRHKFLGV
jgi:SWI/SNF-related matrix-associated actin-dependent regulator 1 of chromatin subfamily A